VVIREELGRLLEVGERHRRLMARLILVLGLTLIVAVVGAILTYQFEAGVKGGDIHGFGDAAFFTAVQLLTVSSQIKNPLTTGGRLVDLVLESWSIFVVTAVAGSFASFFSSGDST
jgi:glucose uptake protein GlcU